MFLVISLLFVVLGNLHLIAAAVFAAGLAGLAWLVATRPAATAPAGVVDLRERAAAVPGPRRPARGPVVPRQYGDRDPLPQRGQAR